MFYNIGFMQFVDPCFQLSVSDPSICTSYTMEVLRDADTIGRPLFSVTCDNGEQVNTEMKVEIETANRLALEFPFKAYLHL